MVEIECATGIIQGSRNASLDHDDGDDSPSRAGVETTRAELDGYADFLHGDDGDAADTQGRADAALDHLPRDHNIAPSARRPGRETAKRANARITPAGMIRPEPSA